MRDRRLLENFKISPNSSKPVYVNDNIRLLWIDCVGVY